MPLLVIRNRSEFFFSINTYYCFGYYYNARYTEVSYDVFFDFYCFFCFVLVCLLFVHAWFPQCSKFYTQEWLLLVLKGQYGMPGIEAWSAICKALPTLLLIQTPCLIFWKNLWVKAENNRWRFKKIHQWNNMDHWNFYLRSDY